MIRHLQILVRARARGWRNVWSRQSTGRIGVLVAVTLAIVGTALGLGELAWEGLAEAPESVATLRLQAVPVAGENALEAAFWLSFLAAAVLGFRVMEILFRRGDMKMLERLPLSPSALFLERTTVALAEGLLAAIPLALFFLPLALHGYPMAAVSAIALVAAAMVCTVAICVGANVYIGVQFGAPSSSGLGDAYGSSGGAFIYGPAAGMAASAVSVLILKLAAGELLAAQGWSNAVGLGFAIAAGLAIAFFLTGLRDYRRGSHLVAAWFNEADSVGFEAVLDYQTSSWSHKGWETRLPGGASAVYRRLALELPRRHPLTRWLNGAGVAAVFLGVWNWPLDAFPNWVPVALFVAMTSVISSPWSRARRLPGSDAWEWFPLSESTERLAATTRAGLEALAVGALFAAATVAGAALAGRPLDASVVTTVVALTGYPLLVTGVLGVLPYARWNDLGRGVSVGSGLALMAGIFAGPTIGLVVAGAVWVLGLAAVAMSWTAAKAHTSTPSRPRSS